MDQDGDSSNRAGRLLHKGSVLLFHVFSCGHGRSCISESFLGRGKPVLKSIHSWILLDLGWESEGQYLILLQFFFFLSFARACHKHCSDLQKYTGEKQ